MSHNNLIEEFNISKWDAQHPVELQQHAINQLEQGKVLYCPRLAFEIKPAEMRFISSDFSDSTAKNISYNSRTGQLKGATGAVADMAQIGDMMARFSQFSLQLIESLFPHYQTALEIARTSFRPVQITDRVSSYRKDDRRLHVDAFPATPNQGRRILRVFSNINLAGEDRIWNLGEPFETVARRFLPQISRPIPGSSKFLEYFKITKTKRSEYDHIMLKLHNHMKKDQQYQHQVVKTQFNFAPASTWIVQTDHVSHAALSGQHLLEQTFYLPVSAMLNSEHSPLKILERLSGRMLI